MIVLHGLKTCDTCRKVLRDLRAAGREGRLRDLRDAPLRAEELSLWLGALGLGLLNIRSATWRGLTEAERAQAPEALMLAHPALVKRPVVEAGGGLHLGWSPATKAALGL